MKKFNAIEGDYLQTKDDNLIFDVKGVKHPNNKIICFIRFFPHPFGDREINCIKYKKVYDLQDRYTFLKENYPKYIFFSKQHDMELQGVDLKDIKKIYTPRNYYQKLLKKSKPHIKANYALKLCNLIIQNSNLSEDMIGITGSQMVGLNKNNSDIDLVIYGTKNSIDFQKSITDILNQPNNCRRYHTEELKSHYNFRAGGSDISINDFVKYEKQKLHQGKYYNLDFYIRYIKSPEDWNEDYYDYEYKDLGIIKIMAKITNANDSIFTPCKYKIDVIRILECLHKIDQNDIKEIISYRGRFCEHARKRDFVMVEGKLEKIIIKKQGFYYRIILGNNKKDKMLII
ncbi:MAG: hypothetical protein KGD63_11940 [Candidatus Lokiarchaeota archaeon]|nr:hypothetical protein [Candidatus Lokiarchaeota archaeon]